MKFGAHCVLFGPEIGTNTAEVLARLAKAGAAGCELGQRFFSLDRREELTGYLSEAGIELAGLHCNELKLADLLFAPEKARQALLSAAEFMASMKNKNVIATGGIPFEEMRQRPIGEGVPIPELHQAENARRMAEALNSIAKEAKEIWGVQVHYHNHSWEFADGGMLWFALADYAPEVQFALDTGWAAVSGFDPLELIKRYPGRFGYIHLRDYTACQRPEEKIFSQVHEGFVTLGTGAMGYPKLLRHLEEALGADAWAIVEYELGNFDQQSYTSALSYLHGLEDMYREIYHGEA